MITQTLSELFNVYSGRFIKFKLTGRKEYFYGKPMWVHYFNQRIPFCIDFGIVDDLKQLSDPKFCLSKYLSVYNNQIEEVELLEMS